MNKFLLLFLLFISEPVFSQELLVPYHGIGGWGLSDTLGNIKAPAVYSGVYYRLDEFDRKSALPPGYYLIRKAGGTGIWHEGEMIPPVYTRIRLVNDLYFIAYSNHTIGAYYNMDGKSMLPPRVKEMDLIWLFRDKNNREVTNLIFICTYPYNIFSVYSFNQLDSAKSKMLLEGYYSIEQKATGNYTDINIIAVKEKGGARELYRLSKDQATGELIMKKLPPPKEEPGTEGSMYSGAGRAAANGRGIGSGDRAGDGMGPGSRGERGGGEGDPGSDYKPRKTISVSREAKFLIRNWGGELELIHHIRYNNRDPEDKGKNHSSFFKLPDGATGIKIHYNIYQEGSNVISGDTSTIYTDFLTYTLNGKKGFAAQEKVIPAIFDSLRPVGFEKDWKRAAHFVFGNRDHKGKMRFGLVDMKGNIIMPADYDTIITRNYKVNDFIRDTEEWIVIKNGKYGMIHPHKEFIAPDYDEITRVDVSGKPKFFVLKKDNLYGFYCREQKEVCPQMLVPPFTKYNIRELNFIPRNESRDGMFFPLMLLENERGQTLGYADMWGREYFKD
jgi:hypothetical protein